MELYIVKLSFIYEHLCSICLNDYELNLRHRPEGFLRQDAATWQYDALGVNVQRYFQSQKRWLGPLGYWPGGGTLSQKEEQLC